MPSPLRRPPYRVFLLTLISALLLGALSSGCGGDEESESQDVPAEQDDGIPSGDTATPYTPEEQDLVDLVQGYFAAIAAKDWVAVCDSATKQAQLGIGEPVGGDCEEAVQIIYDTPQFENLGESFSDKNPQTIEIDGERAEIDLGNGDPFIAVIEAGEWKLDLD